MSPKKSALCSEFKFIGEAKAIFSLSVTEYHLPQTPRYSPRPVGILASLVWHFQDGLIPWLANWCELSYGSSTVAVDGGGVPQSPVYGGFLTIRIPKVSIPRELEENHTAFYYLALKVSLTSLIPQS